jgi:hypothetical protein
MNSLSGEQGIILGAQGIYSGFWTRAGNSAQNRSARYRASMEDKKMINASGFIFVPPINAFSRRASGGPRRIAGERNA